VEDIITHFIIEEIYPNNNNTIHELYNPPSERNAYFQYCIYIDDFSTEYSCGSCNEEVKYDNPVFPSPSSSPKALHRTKRQSQF
jgi:hypothetical protein